ncbi:MAG: cell envelope integrity EipB family protein, partial [Rhizobiaceae bacterium]|nr:cell envelope integrity EipB family protein [Rhizobiaceae bacterium]
MNSKLTSLMVLSASILSVTPAQAIGFEIIAPHRAVYDIKLVDATERSGIKQMEGRMVYEVSGNECDGISLKFRFLTNIATSRDQFVSDQTTSTYESADGKSFSFLSKSYLNEQLEETVKGMATQTDEGVYVTLDSPTPQEFEFPKARFLTSYLVKIIELAKDGERFLRDDLYDGSDGGDETIATS